MHSRAPAHPATNSPTKAAFSCQLRGIWSPQGCPAAPHHPSTHWKPLTPAPCQGSLSREVFQTLTFEFGYITEFTLIEKNKSRSYLLNVYLRPKIAIKRNQMGDLKQISLICYQAGKKLGKKTPLKGIKSVGSHTSIRGDSVEALIVSF